MYCNAACKKKHRQKHKKQCERIVAELHDEKLFKQPPPEEDCPICMIRLPSLITGQMYMACCGKVICRGCIHAVQSRVAKEEDDKCIFCRIPNPASDEEVLKRLKKRVEMNDFQAIHNTGNYYAEGLYGLPQNYAKALELWHRAVELGSTEALTNISVAYKDGRGVEVDEKKAIYYCELAAMSGNFMARCHLGAKEVQAGKMDRALKHWEIAVKDGNANALKGIKLLYKEGEATKDEYAKALRSYQSYLDEIRSDQRDEAAAFSDRYKYYESAF